MFHDAIIRAIRYLVYAIVILVPLAYLPTGMYPFQVVKTVLFQGITEIVVVLYLALAIFHKEYRPRRTPLNLVLLAFLFILSLSTVFGVDWRTSLFSDEQRTLGLVAVFHFAALYLVLSSLRKEIQWNALWRVSVGTAVLVSLIGLLQLFLSLPKESYSQWLYILFEKPTPRIGSTFSNSAFLAGYLLFHFFLALLLSGRAWVEKKMSALVAFFAAGILILIAIFLSQTLGVLLGMAVGLTGLLAYFAIKRIPRHSVVRRISIALLLVIVAFGALLWLTKTADVWQKIPGVRRIAAFSFDDLSVSTRLLTWQIALESFRDKPILGWGPENFRIAYNAHYNPQMFTIGISGTYWDKPHNVLLEYLTTAGILGILSYLGIFAALFYTLVKVRALAGAAFFEAPILAAMLVGYLVQNLVVFDTIGTYLMFFLVLAYIDSRYGEAYVKRANTVPVASGEERRFGLSLRQVAMACIVLALIPVYFNYRIVNASRLEYQGVNYFLNSFPETSFVAFNKALATPTPYRDDIRKNFASTVSQAYKQGIEYPRIEELHKRLMGELQKVIENHPRDFFNYVALADVKNIFYKLDPRYPAEAESLAMKALELSPRRQQVYYVLAAARFAKGDTAGAYRIFEEVVALNPEAGDSHFFYGLMAYGVGDTKKGRAEIARAYELGRKPRSTGEAMLLATLVGDKEENYKEAIELYGLAMSYTDLIHGELRDRTVLEINLKNAVAYYLDGDRDQAARYFRQVKEKVDLTTLPNYSELEPVLRSLGVI